MGASEEIRVSAERPCVAERLMIRSVPPVFLGGGYIDVEVCR